MGTRWPLTRPWLGDTVTVGGGSSGPLGSKAIPTDASDAGGNTLVATSLQALTRQSTRPPTVKSLARTRTVVRAPPDPSAVVTEFRDNEHPPKSGLAAEHSAMYTIVPGVKPVPSTVTS